MMTWQRTVAAALAVGVLALGGRAEEKKEKSGSRSDPAGAPVEAVLKARKASYTLDLGGKTAAEFRKELDTAATNGNYPPAPEVDLELQLRNTGKKDVTIKVGGTPTVIELRLKGPDAVTVPLRHRATPKIYILPREVVLGPGKGVTVPIKRLAFGFRGDASRAYWLKPGKYTLSASYKTSISPAPEGAKDVGKGFGAVVLTSAPISLEVKAK